MMKARIWGKPNEEEMAKRVIAIKCPGCNTIHTLNTKQYVPNIPVWSWNGSFDKPTFSPSLLVRTGKYVPGYENFNVEGHPELSSVCHSFIKEGKIQFLGDCTHSLKNMTVDLPDIE